MLCEEWQGNPFTTDYLFIFSVSLGRNESMLLEQIIFDNDQKKRKESFVLLYIYIFLFVYIYFFHLYICLLFISFYYY